MTSSPASAISARTERRTVAQRSVSWTHAVRLTCGRARQRSAQTKDARRETHINELERVPDFEERNRGELQSGYGREAEDVCADVEELVDDVGDEPERACGCGGDALGSGAGSVPRS